jgi:hypothetical protein
MAKPEQKFLLNVSYPADRHPGFGLDSTIRGIVGRPETGAGTDLKSMTRDMSFEFDDKGEAKKALSRLKKKKIEAEVRPS